MSETPEGVGGTLFGVGVGPGDPELLTLKAARILASVPVVAYFHKRGGQGHAHGIVGARLAAHVEELPIAYPLTTEAPPDGADYEHALTECYDRAAGLIGDRLARRQDVALICEGDPFFYGSFMHVFKRLKGDHKIQVVPGITGMSACWTRALTPMTFGDDTLQVLPGVLPEAVLIERMKQGGAVVIMKLGSGYAKVRRAVEAAGLIDRAVYVERGSMIGEVITPLAERTEAEAPYFAMILVPGRGRCL
jgi:precorrin-2/cobalt-factor-2 C20-methyltransferase